MPGTFVPAQQFDHELNVVKGWPSPYAIDKSKPLGAGEPVIPAGRCMYIDHSTNVLRLGCPIATDGTWASMPIWALQSSTDFDVLSDRGNISGGHMTGLVGAHCYEVETTEYTGTGFHPNAPLSCAEDAGGEADGTTRGKVKATSLQSADTIIGISSEEGPLTNEWKKTVVRFWTVYIPYRSTGGSAHA